MFAGFAQKLELEISWGYGVAIASMGKALGQIKRPFSIGLMALVTLGALTYWASRNAQGELHSPQDTAPEPVEMLPPWLQRIQVYHGLIGSYFGSTLVLQVNEGSVLGYYYYDTVKKPIYLSGHQKDNHFVLKEKWQGKALGSLRGELDETGTFRGWRVSEGSTQKLSVAARLDLPKTTKLRDGIKLSGLLGRYEGEGNPMVELTVDVAGQPYLSVSEDEFTWKERVSLAGGRLSYCDGVFSGPPQELSIHGECFFGFWGRRYSSAADEEANPLPTGVRKWSRKGSQTSSSEPFNSTNGILGFDDEMHDEPRLGPHYKMPVEFGSIIDSGFRSEGCRAIGDFNGDGFSDLFCWAEGEKDYFYFGNSTGASPFPQWHLGYKDDDQKSVNFFEHPPRPHFGFGDFNGDSLTDVAKLVVTRTSDGSLLESSDYEVYFGNTRVLGVTSDWQYRDTGSEWDAQKLGVGDVNGDGFDDLLMLSQRYGSPNAKWKLDVFAGSSKGLSNPYSVDLAVGSKVKYHLDVEGDLNGDKIKDVVLFECCNGNGSLEQDSIVVFYGRKGRFEGDPDWRLEGRSYNSVSKPLHRSSVWDANGDGIDDLVLTRFARTAANEIDFYHYQVIDIFHGTPNGLPDPRASR